ncbi:pyridoxal phosphate-dependent aminotransferase [Clostridium aminobutyricum]|uniref:Aminotransferase n=1 Tax=Clostridium aminobutyricum TaxID=33953 RepID=A0A939DAK3_CLOAM|nr:pyridoxal phosphate-dependent aminotransferase [Clostridium aminobutyricum]MBN7774272.1 pyridoxal phosphate-dependent aminotransferase [Clostridium aminobutyricum]
MNSNQLQETFLSDKAKMLLHHPQGMGNYFTFKSAVDILGLNWDELLPNGIYNVTGEGYYDMGYMANLIGPPASAINAMKEHSTVEELRVYPPDLLPELKAEVARRKFGRELSEDFTVLGVEGAQGGIGYTYATFLNPGDEVITTDPAYFHFVPGAEICGATVKPIKLGKHNGYKLDPKELEAAITPKTKMIVVCDPINPFGVVATKEELLEIAAIARKNNIIIFNNITHNTHQTDASAQHYAMASLHTPETPMDHVISVSGVSKGYGLPALRVGFMAGHPALIRGAFLIKMETTKIHINYPGQYATLAAMRDHDYVEKSTEIVRRNYKHIEETVAMTEGVTIPVKPQYGFCMIIDVSGTGVSAQEISTALLKYKIGTITGDGLGEEGAVEYIRLNYSHPDIECFELFREALPKAIADAKQGIYRQAVIDFFERVGTERGKRIIEQIKNR